MQREREHAWRVIGDLAEDRSTHEVLRDEGVRVLRTTGTAIRRAVTERYAIRHDRVDSASGRTEWRCALSRSASGGEPGWNVEVVTRRRDDRAKRDHRLPRRAARAHPQPPVCDCRS